MPFIQHQIALARGDERHGEAEAVFVHFHAAFDDFQFFGGAHKIAAVNQNLPVARHGFEAAFKKFVFALADGQLLGEAGDFLRHACGF